MLVNYTMCRTGIGNLLRWKTVLDPGLEDTSYRGCGGAEEAGTHTALICSENGELGRRFGSWGQADDPERVFRQVKGTNWSPSIWPNPSSHFLAIFEEGVGGG